MQFSTQTLSRQKYYILQLVAERLKESHPPHFALCHMNVCKMRIRVPQFAALCFVLVSPPRGEDGNRRLK